MANETVYDRAAHDMVWVGDGTADYRARMASRRAEALEHWRRELAEQSSVLNSPSDRIRIWERRHQIDLPRDPRHNLIKLIATNTGLSVEDVYAEQRLREEVRTGVVGIVP